MVGASKNQPHQVFHICHEAELQELLHGQGNAPSHFPLADFICFNYLRNDCYRVS